MNGKEEEKESPWGWGSKWKRDLLLVVALTQFGKMNLKTYFLEVITKGSNLTRLWQRRRWDHFDLGFLRWRAPLQWLEETQNRRKGFITYRSLGKAAHVQVRECNKEEQYRNQWANSVTGWKALSKEASQEILLGGFKAVGTSSSSHIEVLTMSYLCTAMSGVQVSRDIEDASS